jgi:MoaA/NifB/PqqE/SkfB family radical SAM enzyme
MRLIKAPVLCNYYVTYRCNASCGFCDIWEKPSPYVNLHTAGENFKSLKKLGVKVIDFTGGEPLLHREIDQLLSLAKKHGFITTLTTNCLLYPKWATRLTGLVDMLHFSLDSADKDKHDKGRGVACFDKVLESIRIAKDLGERPDILFTVFDTNFREAEEIYENISQPSDLVLILNPAFSYGATGEEISDDTIAFLKNFARKKNVYLNEAFLQLRKDGGNHISNPVCRAASSSIVISPENKLLVPCYHLSKQEFQIENNLFSLYNSETVKKITEQEGKLPECEGCTINCYMQPSFAVEISKYWFRALPSTIKYNRLKGTWKKILGIRH